MQLDFSVSCISDVSCETFPHCGDLFTLFQLESFGTDGKIHLFTRLEADVDFSRSGLKQGTISFGEGVLDAERNNDTKQQQLVIDGGRFKNA